MSLTDRVPIARRKMILFFLIDTSASMSGKKIQSVNDAIENVLPIIGEISDENPDAEINIAAMKFSTGADWVYNEPKEAKDFIWQTVSPEALTSLGEACRELSRKLSRTNGFMPTSTGSGYYAPAIILLSDGGPTDDFQGGLKVLKENSWFKNAIKVAIAIGNDADENVLKDFTGSPEAVIKVHNIDALKAMIRVIAVTSSQIGSKSSSAGDTSKQEEVIKEITASVKDTHGAESTAVPATGDNYDDWD